MASKFTKVDEKNPGLVVIGKSRNSSGRERAWQGAITTGFVLLDGEQNNDRLIEVEDLTANTKNKKRLIRLSTFSGNIGTEVHNNFKAADPAAIVSGNRTYTIKIKTNGQVAVIKGQFPDWTAANVQAQAFASTLQGEIVGIS
jgi:hypothetical protein